MKFNTHVAMKSHPGFNVDAQVNPIDFDASVHGTFEATAASISINVDEIPIRLAIPFLKRRKPPVFASVGGFKMKFSPLQVKVEKATVQLGGTLGTEGIIGKMNGEVDCETEMDVDGNLVGKVGTFSVELGDKDSDCD